MIDHVILEEKAEANNITVDEFSSQINKSNDLINKVTNLTIKYFGNNLVNKVANFIIKGHQEQFKQSECE